MQVLWMQSFVSTQWLLPMLLLERVQAAVTAVPVMPTVVQVFATSANLYSRTFSKVLSTLSCKIFPTIFRVSGHLGTLGQTPKP